MRSSPSLGPKSRLLNQIDFPLFPSHHEGGLPCRFLAGKPRHDQLASVQAAVSMELELESSSISVSMVCRSVLLEGYVADYGDREKATAIAALIASPENVHDRMRDRY
ncbi:BON domain-containing protein [Rhizobium leguminosarum]